VPPFKGGQVLVVIIHYTNKLSLCTLHTFKCLKAKTHLAKPRDAGMGTPGVEHEAHMWLTPAPPRKDMSHILTLAANDRMSEARAARQCTQRGICPTPPCLASATTTTTTITVASTTAVTNSIV